MRKMRLRERAERWGNSNWGEGRVGGYLAGYRACLRDQRKKTSEKRRKLRKEKRRK